MTRPIGRWLFGILAGTVLFVMAAIFWLVATEGGARWLLARATPSLPREISIARMDGTLLRGLEFSSLRWDGESLFVSVDSVRTQFELLPLFRRTLRINALEVRTVEVRLGDRPGADVDEPPFALDLPLTVALDASSIGGIRVVVGDRQYLVDHISLSGKLSGPELDIPELAVASDFADLEISGGVRLVSPYEAAARGSWSATLPGQPVLAGQMELHGNKARYEIQHALTAPHAIATSGWFTIDAGEIRFDVDNTWQILDISSPGDRSVQIRDGLLHVEGSPGHFRFDGNTTIETADIPALFVSATGDTDTDRIGIASLSISSEWGRLLTSGSLDLTAAPEWDLVYEISDVDPAFARFPLTGRLRSSGSSLGRIVDRRVTASVAVDSLAGDLNGFPVTGSAALSYDDELLRFEDLRIDVGDNQVVLDGVYGTKIDINAALRLGDIGQLLVDAGGAASGELRVRSEAERLTLAGHLNADSLAWKSHSVDRLETRFRLPTTGTGNIFLRARGAAVDRIALESVALDGAGTADSHRLEASIDAPTGRLELLANGRYADQRWTGSLDALALRGAELGEWTLQQKTGVRISASAAEIDRACLAAIAAAGTACIEMRYEKAGPLGFDTSISGLPVAALPLFLPAASSITGSIEGEGRGEFIDRRLRADARVRILDLGLRTVYEDEEIAAEFDVATLNASVLNNRLDAKLELAATDRSARASAAIELADILDRASPLAGTALLELGDLSLISFLYPDVTNTTGRVGGTVDVSGSLIAPEFVGEIALEEGSFDVRRAGISVRDVALRLRQFETGRLSLEGSAKSGEGHLSISGTTALSSTEGIRTQLTLDGQKFALIRLPEWQVSASPSIDVVLDDRAARISGELVIPDANIVIHDLPESAEEPSADVVVHRADEPQETVRRDLFVDVRTVLGDAVWLSGFGLTTGLEGSVRVTGGSRSPYAGSGRLTLREGEYRAYGQLLQIERGELIFNGPLDDPVLDIRATRTASDDVVAGIHLTGTPSQPRSAVFSDPVMGDAEALSYLLTGRPLMSANAEQGDMLNQAAFALGLSTAGSVVSRISNQLGLDTLAVEGGSGAQQIVAGKRFGSRLLVEYAYGIVDNLGTLLLRYQLNNRLVLESRSGSVNNVDIVYSVKRD